MLASTGWYSPANFYCVVPWASVFMLRCEVEDAIITFPSSVPAELAAN